MTIAHLPETKSADALALNCLVPAAVAMVVIDPKREHIAVKEAGVTAGLRTDLMERDTVEEYSVVNGAVNVPVDAREFVTVRLLPAKAR